MTSVPEDSWQAFVDSGQIHFTFFANGGEELPVSSLAVEGTSPSGSTLDLAPERFGPGHFVSTAELEPGEWQVRVTARTAEGEPLRGTFAVDV